MIYNGELPLVSAAIWKSPGIAGTSNNTEVNLLRITNENAAAQTFTIYINVNGTARAITPINTQLPIGAIYDDFPVMQLPPGATIEGAASAASISWTINTA